MNEKIKSLMDEGIFLDPEVIDLIDKSSFDLINDHRNEIRGQVVNRMLLDELKLKYLKSNDLFEDDKFQNNGNVKILKSYEDSLSKIEVAHFVEHYRTRYNFMSKLLQGRMELTDAVSISRTFSKMQREKVSLIGIVYDKKLTKNGNLILEIEDPTGKIKILINSTKKEIFDMGKDIVLDEVIGIVGNMGNKIVFVNELFFPDVKIDDNIMKKSKKNEYVAFISDLHVGSDMFLEKDFEKFITWINGNSGSEDQKQIAKSIKYLFVIGDIVDGVGIYPSQENELSIINIQEQYDKCAYYFSKMRKDLNIIICPGNHDALRLAEPQPILDKNIAKSLYDLDNVQLVSNPAVINIGSYDGFEGFNVLMYHGYSFDYYIDKVESIREHGGYDRADLVMKFLMKKRHLAPSHGSTLFVVDADKDELIIDDVPDLFVCGHVHKSSVSHYGKTTLISGSCWQSITKFQEKVGHHPEPGRVPIVNLKTRDVKLMKFCN
jgi:DNA polymerase II small subunit